MQLSKQCKIDQISRFSGLPGFPKTPEGIRELIDSLENVAKSEMDAVELVTEIVRSAIRSPVPADFYRIGRERALYAQPMDPKEVCADCDGTGYRPVLTHCNTVERCPCSPLRPRGQSGVSTETESGESA